MVAPLIIGAALEIARIAAPGLIRHLSGSDKAAEVAGELIESAQAVTGTGSPQEAIAKLRADPNLVLQLQGKSIEIEARLEEAYLKDRQDARGRDIEYVRAGFKNRRGDWMVALDVVGLLACLLAIFYLPPDAPGELRGLLATIAAYFGLGLRDAHQFEFGSSRGSKQKDDVLSRRVG